MSRITWFMAGALTGIYGVVKTRRAARNFTPDGIAARAAAVGVGLRVFSSELTVGMAQRETELRRQLAVEPVETAAEPAMIEPAPAAVHRTGEPKTLGHR